MEPQGQAREEHELRERQRRERKQPNWLKRGLIVGAVGLVGVVGGARVARDRGIERTNARIEEQCQLASQYAEQGKADEAVQAYNEAVRIYNETPLFFLNEPIILSTSPPTNLSRLVIEGKVAKSAILNLENKNNRIAAFYTSFDLATHPIETYKAYKAFEESNQKFIY